MLHHQAGRISRRAMLRAALGGAGAVTVASVLAACSPAGGGATGASGAASGAATSAPAPSGATSTGGATSSSSNGSLKIGLLSGFSGPYAAFGPDMAGPID